MPIKHSGVNCWSLRVTNMKHQLNILRKLQRTSLKKQNNICTNKLKVLLPLIISTIRDRRIYFLLRISSSNLYYKILTNLGISRHWISGELVSMNWDLKIEYQWKLLSIILANFFYNLKIIITLLVRLLSGKEWWIWEFYFSIGTLIKFA